MPRKFFARFSPSVEKLKKRRSLRWVEPFIVERQLLNVTRRSISRAFFIGFFVAALPPLPIQMLIASAFAVVARANLAISAGLVWVSNPLTFGFILYLEWWIGAKVLGLPTTHSEINVSNWMQLFSQIGKPLLLGTIIWALVSGALAYLTIQIIWRVTIVSRHRRIRK